MLFPLLFPLPLFFPPLAPPPRSLDGVVVPLPFSPFLFGRPEEELLRLIPTVGVVVDDAALSLEVVEEAGPNRRSRASA